MRQMFVPISGSQAHSLWQAERVKAGRGLDVAEPSDSRENYRHLLLHSHTCGHSCLQCTGCLAENSGKEGGREVKNVSDGEQAQVFVKEHLNF